MKITEYLGMKNSISIGGISVNASKNSSMGVLLGLRGMWGVGTWNMFYRQEGQTGIPF